MEEKSVKLCGPIFISPLNLHYRMVTSSSNYEFPILANEVNTSKVKTTGRVLKKKKR